MNLSNTLFSTISKKLKFNESSLQKEKIYIKNLFVKTKNLKATQHDSKLIDKNTFNQKQNNANNIVTYTINISFLKANTFIHLSNIKGETLLFFSAGQVNLSGKQKKNRRVAITKLIALFSKKATFIGSNPIAVHLKNVKSHKFTIINKLKNFYWIKIIKSFNQIPFNGCRKNKIRRKKFTKKFK